MTLYKKSTISAEDLARVPELSADLRTAFSLADQLQKDVAKLPRHQVPMVPRSVLRRLTVAVKSVVVARAQQALRHHTQHKDVLRRLRNARNQIRQYALRNAELRTQVENLKEGQEPRDQDVPNHSVRMM